VPLFALEDTGLEPHPDKPEDARISNPVRQHTQQPLVVDRVEGDRDTLPISASFPTR
jgi:hypothetical protein